MPASGAALRFRLDEDEADVVRNVAAEMLEFLRAEQRDDPVTRRLFPDAYESDRESRAWHDLIDHELEAAKIGALETVLATLGSAGSSDVVLTAEQVEAWLTALTDMRLAIGTRVGVTEEDMAADVDPEDPRAAPLAYLHWLGWLQGSMLESLEDQ
jgi:hypothetical protein